MGEACRTHLGTRLFAQYAMNQLYAHRALANGGRDSLGAAAAYIAHGEYSRNCSFKMQRRTRQWPSVGEAILALPIRPGPHKAPFIQPPAAPQPPGVGH